VTKRRAEEEAEYVRARFEAITANTKDVILTIDPANSIRFADQAVEDLLGYGPDSPIGESLTTLIASRYRDGPLDAIESSLATGAQLPEWTAVKMHAHYRDGSDIPVSALFSTFELSGDRRVVGVPRDVSDQVRLADELRESEQRFRQLAENIQEMVWMTDPEKGEVLFVNPAYEEIWGVSPDSLYDDPQSYLETIHPEDRDRVKDVLDPRSTGSYDETYRITRPDGEVRWMHDRAVPVRNDAGEIYRTVGIASDITERKHCEQDHSRSVELLSHTERIADVGSWEINSETQDVFWSDHLFELLGFVRYKEWVAEKFGIDRNYEGFQTSRAFARSDTFAKYEHLVKWLPSFQHDSRVLSHALVALTALVTPIISKYLYLNRGKMSFVGDPTPGVGRAAINNN